MAPSRSRDTPPREMVETERGMAANAREMTNRTDHAVDRRHVETALQTFDRAIHAGAEQSLAKAVRAGEIEPRRKRGVARPPQALATNSAGRCGISRGMRDICRHRSGRRWQEHDARAARQAWEAQGYRVSAQLWPASAEGLENPRASGAARSRATNRAGRTGRANLVPGMFRH